MTWTSGETPARSRAGRTRWDRRALLHRDRQQRRRQRTVIPRRHGQAAPGRASRSRPHRVGVRDLHFLGYPDGQVEATLPTARRDLAQVIRMLRPDPLPVARALLRPAGRPPHRAVGSAALDAYPDARNPFAFPKLLSRGKARAVDGTGGLIVRQPERPTWTSPRRFEPEGESPHWRRTPARSPSRTSWPTGCGAG